MSNDQYGNPSGQPPHEQSPWNQPSADQPQQSWGQQQPGTDAPHDGGYPAPQGGGHSAPQGGEYGAPQGGYQAPEAPTSGYDASQASPYGAPQTGAPQTGAPQAGGWDQPASTVDYSQAYPPPGPPVPTERPKSLTYAVYAMYAGAVLAIIGLIVGMTAGASAARKAAKEAAPDMTDAQINTLVTVGLVTAAVFGVLGAALWVWMAVMNGKGRKWARITGTVFFGISVLSFLYSVAQPSATTSSIAMGVLQLLVGIAATFFMWQRSSSDYYEAMSRPRTM